MVEKVTLSLSGDALEKLRGEAKRQKRSMSKEVEWLIENNITPKEG